ncbi:GGDEF domain-containing protein, partial [Aromatoleum petrolei]|nr:GGDEF domain-containing protein [Aromatoleum petrolei]
MPPTLPSEIAREVLRLIAARRLPPTPENFTALYHEVAGTPPASAHAEARLLAAFARQLPRDTAERARFARALDQALAEGNTDKARQAFGLYLASLKSDQEPAWNELIATLLRQWETRQIGWTIARKRESLERVLAAN